MDRHVAHVFEGASATLPTCACGACSGHLQAPCVGYQRLPAVHGPAVRRGLQRARGCSSGVGKNSGRSRWGRRAHRCCRRAAGQASRQLRGPWARPSMLCPLLANRSRPTCCPYGALASLSEGAAKAGRAGGGPVECSVRSERSVGAVGRGGVGRGGVGRGGVGRRVSSPRCHRRSE